MIFIMNMEETNHDKMNRQYSGTISMSPRLSKGDIMMLSTLNEANPCHDMSWACLS